jgi:serpin B
MKKISIPLLVFIFLGDGSVHQAEGQKIRTLDEKTDLRLLVEGNNQFALDLYRQLSTQEGNLIFSPFSISTALGMTYTGARGETAEQMAKAMRFTLPQERLHRSFAYLIGQLQGESKTKPYHLYLANALWGQKGYSFLEDFTRVSREHYHAGLHELDFLSQPEEARKSINKWVEQQTKDKIKEILTREDVQQNPRLILTNAIYFQSNWKDPFSKELTKIKPFELTKSEKRLVPMMNSSSKVFKYHATPEFSLLELPYKEDVFSMVVLLPKKRGGLPELEKKLTISYLNEALAKLSPQLLEVALPRFKVTRRFSLVSELVALGMENSFSDKANFSGISKKENLRIKDVVHKAYVDVDELGTEAAAATAVIVLPGNPIISFQADHPFIFLIRDCKTGTFLFIGRVRDPQN